MMKVDKGFYNLEGWCEKNVFRM